MKSLLFITIFFIGISITSAKAVTPIDTATNTNGNYHSRVVAIHKLGRNLSSNEIARLYNFLDSYFTNQNTLTKLQFNAIKNEILNILIRQKKTPPLLLEKIVENYKNERHDIMWRGYCLQHLEQYYHRKLPSKSKMKEIRTLSPAATVPNEKVARKLSRILKEEKIIFDTLATAATNTVSPKLSGTAKLILNRMIESRTIN